MGKLAKDAKDLLVGSDGSDKEPNDFKSELQAAIKDGTVSKSDGTLLITSRMNTDKLAEKMEKRQLEGLKKAKDGVVYDSPEEELEAKKEKAEKERKRREKEAQIARQMQAAQEKSRANNNPIRTESQKNMDEKQ